MVLGGGSKNVLEDVLLAVHLRWSRLLSLLVLSLLVLAEVKHVEHHVLLVGIASSVPGSCINSEKSVPWYIYYATSL
jgi:hypothetical protein